MNQTPVSMQGIITCNTIKCMHTWKSMSAYTAINMLCVERRVWLMRLGKETQNVLVMRSTALIISNQLAPVWKGFCDTRLRTFVQKLCQIHR